MNNANQTQNKQREPLSQNLQGYPGECEQEGSLLQGPVRVLPQVQVVLAAQRILHTPARRHNLQARLNSK